MIQIHVKSVCAPGVSGQRGVHAEQIYALKRETLKQRWFRALHEITAMAMSGTLHECCAWNFNKPSVGYIKASSKKHNMTRTPDGCK